MWSVEVAVSLKATGVERRETWEPGAPKFSVTKEACQIGPINEKSTISGL